MPLVHSLQLLLPQEQEEGYAYHEVVRGRWEREALRGVECTTCKAFYEALATWGANLPAPTCGHSVPQTRPGAPRCIVWRSVCACCAPTNLPQPVMVQ